MLCALVNNLLTYPARLRTSRGFGVHSPFAFRFISDVLRERRYAYYAYHAIEASPSRLPLQRRKLIFRIVNHFYPAKICRLSGDIGLDSAASLAAGHPVAPSTRIWLMTDAEPTTTGNNNILIFPLLDKSPKDRDLWNRTCRSMTFGMTFTNGDVGIAVIDKKLPLTHYNLLF